MSAFQTQIVPSLGKESDEDSDDEDVPELVNDPTYSEKMIPVTILTGFLGSGKTTLLNHILTADHGMRIAVIENEFGEGLGIESMIAKSGVDGDNISNFFELANGCICCTVKDDLLTTLEQLVLHKDRFDYILIETDGLANPGPIVATFWTDSELYTMLHLDGLVCVVDSLNFESYALSAEISSDVRRQLCFADRILLNKSDLATSEQMKSSFDLVREINSFAEIKESSFSNVPIEFVMNTSSYNQNNASDADAPVDSFFLQCIPCDTMKTTSSSSQLHNAQVKANAKALAYMELQDDIDRISKGNDSNDNNNTAEGSWNKSSITHLGSAAAYMSTFYFRFKGLADIQTLKSTLDSMLYDNGMVEEHKRKNIISGTEKDQVQKNIIDKEVKIFRMKAIVHAAESEYLYILQSVHDIFDLQPSVYLVGSEKDITEGDNLFVVVGKNLNNDMIEEKIKSCFQKMS